MLRTYIKQCAHKIQRMHTHLLFKWHVDVFEIHRIQTYFGKHMAVVAGPVEHPGTADVIVLVHSELRTKMWLCYGSQRLSCCAGRY